MNKEIEIPEGYEARIDGNKVILELKESEEERIRKEIIGYLTHRAEVTAFVNETKDCERWISYLEKLKEQKPAIIRPVFRVGDYIRNKRTKDKVLIEQIDIELKCYEYVSYDGAADVHSDFSWAEQDNWELIGQKIAHQPAEWSEDIIRKAVKEVGLTQHQINWFENNVFPPKQEWSEEDKKHIYNAIEAVKYVYDVSEGTSGLKCVKFLKALRPQPK